MTATDIADARATRASGYSWYVCAVLCAVYVVCLVDRFMMSIAIVPLKDSMALSDTQLGLLTGPAFAILYCTASIPFGRLVDFTNRRNMIAIGCVVWTFATGACALAKDFNSLFAARVIVGLGEATFVPASLSLLAAYFTKAHIGRAVGLFQTGVPIGKFVAFVGGGAVLQLVAINGGLPTPFGLFEPWRVLFLAAAGPGLIVAALMLSVQEPTRSAQTAQSTNADAFSAFFRRHWAAFVLHTAAWASLTVLGNVYAAWAPSFYVRQFEMDVFGAATLVGVLGLLGGACGFMIGGVVLDTLNRRGAKGAAGLTMIVASIIAAIAAAIFVLGGSLYESAAGFTLLVGATSMGAGPPGLATLQLMTPAARRGLVTAIAFASSGLLAIGLGPLVIGALSDGVFAAAGPRSLGLSILTACIACAVLAALLALAALRPVRRTIDEAGAN